MKFKHFFTALILSLTPLSNHAVASLIGDRVTCSFEVDAAVPFDIGGPCSIWDDAYRPSAAIVREGGLDGTEFFLGAIIDFGRPTFFTGADVDIGASSITFAPRRLLTDFGIGGSLFIEIGSLDWVGNPNGIISDIIATAINLDPSTLTVTHTDHSVRIAIENTALNHDTLRHRRAYNKACSSGSGNSISNGFRFGAYHGSPAKSVLKLKAPYAVPHTCL